MATLAVGGITVHYGESGHGPPVVLLHAGGSSGAQWRRVSERLNGRYRLLALDFYGHGGTDPWPGSPETRTHDDEAALVFALLSHIGEPAHLVAHSYGAAVAVRLVLAKADGLRSLFLIEPVLAPILREGGETGLAEEYLHQMRRFIDTAIAGDAERAWADYLDANDTPGAWAAMSERGRQRILAATEVTLSVCYANLSHRTSLQECVRIVVPTTLAYGERTKNHYRRTVELLAEAIDLARLHVLSGAPHMSPLTHPDAVAEGLQAHLQSHS